MKIFGLNITNIRKKDFLKEICSLKEKKIVFTPNPEILLEASRDKKFKNILKEANYLLPDGIGLYIAFQVKTSPLTPLLKGEGNISKISIIFGNIILLPYYFFNLFFRRKGLYEKYGERICGSDLTNYLVEYAEKNDIYITIIDLYSPLYIPKICMQKVFRKRLKKQFPKLKFDYFVYKPDERENIIKKIGKSKSKILFSTLGMKKQEFSVIEIMKNCENIKLGLGVGSSFDYIVGFQKRAPKFFSILGIEWFYRLLIGHRKLNRLKRLWNAIFVFTGKIIVSKK